MVEAMPVYSECNVVSDECDELLEFVSESVYVDLQYDECVCCESARVTAVLVRGLSEVWLR